MSTQTLDRLYVFYIHDRVHIIIIVCAYRQMYLKVVKFGEGKCFLYFLLIKLLEIIANNTHTYMYIIIYILLFKISSNN